MSTNPKDIDLFGLSRINIESADITNTPCVEYWLIPAEGIFVSILFDSKKTLKLALLSARCMATGGTLNLNGEHFNAAYFRDHFLEILDFRGATIGNPH